MMHRKTILLLMLAALGGCSTVGNTPAGMLSFEELAAEITVSRRVLDEAGTESLVGQLERR